MAEDFEIDDSETGEGFPPPERKVITQSYDLSIQTLFEQWTSGTLVLPEIQREYVWDDGRASRLIESLLLNIPIPVLYFAETEDAKLEIIDGHQRVNSVARYLENQFQLSGLAVLADLRGLRFFELPPREQRFLTTRTMRAVVIQVDSHPNMKFEIFERLNTGAVVLNAQELRNSLYRGPFNRMLRELVHNKAFRQAVGTKTPRKRMVDEELLLRFFALGAGLPAYRPPLKRFLNEYMRSVQNASPVTLDALRETFERTIESVSRTLGDGAFRVTDGRGRPQEPAVNRALFDAQMLAFSWAGPVPTEKRDSVKRSVGSLNDDLAFADSIRRATGDRARTLYRVQSTVRALEEAGVTVEPPTGI